MPLHFLPLGLSPRALKIFSAGQHVLLRLAQVFHKPSRKSSELEALPFRESPSAAGFQRCKDPSIPQRKDVSSDSFLCFPLSLKLEANAF